MRKVFFGTVGNTDVFIDIDKYRTTSGKKVNPATVRFLGDFFVDCERKGIEPSENKLKEEVAKKSF